MKTHVLLRRVPGFDAEPGTEVDASEWRNAPLLVEQRYLKALDATADPDGLTLPLASFEQRVIDVIKKHLIPGGELADLLVQRLQASPEPALTAKSRKLTQS